MFNYSLTGPYCSGGGTFGQYTLPYDYMNWGITNNNLYNYTNSFMYPYYNPAFMGMNPTSTDDSKTEKKKELEYTPVYATEEICKSSQQEETEKNSGVKKAAWITAGLMTTVIAITALVNGKANFNGSTGAYLKHLVCGVGDGIKNFFAHTVFGNLKKVGKFICGKA